MGPKRRYPAVAPVTEHATKACLSLVCSFIYPFMHVTFFQAKRPMLAALIVRSCSEEGAAAITAEDIAAAILCTLPPRPDTAEMFSAFIWNVAADAGPAGCHVVKAAGAIPVLLQALRLWPTEDKVVHATTRALFWLCHYGSDDVRSAVRDVSDSVSLLKSVASSGLECDTDGISRATLVLDLLSAKR